MAVPSSGAISLLKIAYELESDNYNNTLPNPNASGTNYNNFYSHPISLKNMSTGGTGFEAINTANSSSNRPNGSAPHSMSEFYSYDHDLTTSQASGNLVVGIDNIYSSYFYGYGSGFFPSMGSISPQLAASSWGTISSFYWQNSNYYYIYFSGTVPTWNNITIAGNSLGASSTWQTSGSSGYRKYVTTNYFGTTNNATKAIVVT
jgi:hypothetical protein